MRNKFSSPMTENTTLEKQMIKQESDIKDLKEKIKTEIIDYEDYGIVSPIKKKNKLMLNQKRQRFESENKKINECTLKQEKAARFLIKGNKWIKNTNRIKICRKVNNFTLNAVKIIERIKLSTNFTSDDFTNLVSSPLSCKNFSNSCSTLLLSPLDLNKCGSPKKEDFSISKKHSKTKDKNRKRSDDKQPKKKVKKDLKISGKKITTSQNKSLELENKSLKCNLIIEEEFKTNKVKKSKDDKYVIDITLNSKQNDSSRRKVKPYLDNNIPVKDYFSVKTRSQSKKNKEV